MIKSPQSLLFCEMNKLNSLSLSVQEVCSSSLLILLASRLPLGLIQHVCVLLMLGLNGVLQLGSHKRKESPAGSAAFDPGS